MALLLFGVLQIYFPQIFSDPYSEPHDVCRLLGFTAEQCFSRITGKGWCYTSWFYYLETIRVPIALIVWSVAGILFVPIKYTLAFIPFSLFNALGWVLFFHFSFFARSYVTYHMIPYWPIIAAGITLGSGIIMSTDYLLYWWNHKALGNWSRHVGVTEMGMTPEEKEPIYKGLAQEFRAIQKMI